MFRNKKIEQNEQGQIILVAGEGGHFEQMRRFQSRFMENYTGQLYFLTDFKKKSIPENIAYSELGVLRGKGGLGLLSVLRYMIRTLKVLIPILIKGKVRIISTGPGIALFPALIVKVCGGKVVHIETWSRFYSRSSTGNFMYFLADRFYVQNMELLEIYPKAIFSGRL